MVLTTPDGNCVTSFSITNTDSIVTYQSFPVAQHSSLKRKLGIVEHAPSAAGDPFEMYLN